MIFAGAFSGVRAGVMPGCRAGFAVPGSGSGAVRPGEDMAGSARRRARTLGEQMAAGRQPQEQLLAMAYEPAGDCYQPLPQGADHGLAPADAVTGQDVLAGGDGGELVQPAGNGRGE